MNRRILKPKCETVQCRTTCSSHYHRIFPSDSSQLSGSSRRYREALRILADRIFNSMLRFIRKESGFVLTEIIKCDLFILKYNPIGSGYVPLPKFFANKKAIVNVRNSDNRCFGYAVLSALKDHLPGHRKSEQDIKQKEIFKLMIWIRSSILFPLKLFCSSNNSCKLVLISSVSLTPMDIGRYVCM